jgi:Zn-dependent protease/CBS domain-containing protein
MKATLQVGRLLGVPIRIHVTFLLILPLFALTFAFISNSILGFTLSYNNLPVSNATKMALGLMAAVLFFLAVLVHELAHSYVAMKEGYKISGITLFFLGGASEIESQPPDARGEGIMALVGPVASIIIGIVFLPVWYVLAGLNGLNAEIAAITAGLVSFYNLLLGAFNLLPAFPMDGGRVLRAVLAKRMGFARATTVAVQVGKAMAFGLGVAGLILLSPWLIFIALFIYFGAGEEERGTAISTALEGVTVGQIMSSPVATVGPGTTVSELLDKMMSEKHLGYPVVEGDRVLGVVTLQDVQGVPSERRSTTLVEAIMTRQILAVASDTPAVEAIQAVASNRVGRILVIDQDRLVGIVSRSDLMRVLQVRAAEKGRPAPRG